MLTFETINELTLKVTCTGNDVLFTKAGAYIAGDCPGNTNYRFEKVLLSPQNNLAQALLGSLAYMMDEKYEELEPGLPKEKDSYEILLYLNHELLTMIEESINLELLARLYSTQLTTRGGPWQNLL